MGNIIKCCTKQELSESTIESELFKAIKSGDSKQFNLVVEFCKDKIGKDCIDNFQIKHDNIATNPLGLCFLLGNFNFFQILYENDCLVKNMEKIFEISQFDSISYICTKGYYLIFKHYFLDFLKYQVSKNVGSVNSYTMTLSRSFNYKHETTSIPIQLVCLHGHIEILSFIYEHYSLNDYTPKEYNPHYIDELVNENSALVACRGGCFGIVKFLYEKYKADFHLINAYNENAIIITIAGMNSKILASPPSLVTGYINILNYLLQEVKLDIKDSYEEALVLSKGKPAYTLLLIHLRKIGITVDKDAFNEVSYVYDESVLEASKTKNVKILTDSFMKNSEIYENHSLLSSVKTIVYSNEIGQSILI